ncbi:hypothetical protein [Kitasatospora sp. NPDC059599]|uniref:hypothetical protein n=1 Tax=Kitasatospora sp. NPDC059599 TaxID=3346880 RepID=UPI003680D1BD
MSARPPHPALVTALAGTLPVLTPAVLAAAAGLLPWSVPAAVTTALLLRACLRLLAT